MDEAVPVPFNLLVLLWDVLRSCLLHAPRFHFLSPYAVSSTGLVSATPAKQLRRDLRKLNLQGALRYLLLLPPTAISYSATSYRYLLPLPPTATFYSYLLRARYGTRGTDQARRGTRAVLLLAVLAPTECPVCA
eukprot:2277354-Rhodomonas_salina.1